MAGKSKNTYVKVRNSVDRPKGRALGREHSRGYLGTHSRGRGCVAAAVAPEHGLGACRAPSASPGRRPEATVAPRRGVPGPWGARWSHQVNRWESLIWPILLAPSQRWLQPGQPPAWRQVRKTWLCCGRGSGRPQAGAGRGREPAEQPQGSPGPAKRQQGWPRW